MGEVNKLSFPFLLAVLCFIPGSSSQSGTSAQEAVRLQKPLQHEVSVTLKLIQVYVTGKNGKPVLDLTKDDFILYDDGKPQKLTEFEKHVLSLPASAAPAEERAIPTPVPLLPRLLNRKFFLFFDFAYNNPPGVRKMAEAAQHFLDAQVLPSDEIGVLSISTLKLIQIHIDLTTDHRKVRDFVSKIGLGDSSQRFEDSEDEYKRNLAAGNPADARPESKLTQKTVAVPEYNLIDMWHLSGMTYVDCLTALAWALRSIQGQKNLIFFSEGIPYRVVYPFPFPTPLTWKYENMLKEMQTSNVKIYSLFLGGINIGDSQTGAWTLSKTSDDTGGQYWGNMYNYKPFAEKVNAVTGSYYVLGYPVTEKWDGKFHAIKVDVTRPGCDIHAQNGYSNPKLFTDYTDLENKITLVDLALAEKPISQTPARFDMAALPRSTEAANNLLLAAAIPVEKLRNTLGKKIEVVSLVFNEADEIVEMKRTEENFAGIKEKQAHFLSILSVPPGSYKCRIVLRDLETGRAAVAGAPVTILATSTTGIKLFPPLSVRPDRGAFYFKAHGPSAGVDKKAVPLDLKSLLPFDPVQYAPYLERTLYRESEAWAVICCAVPEGSSPKLTLTSYLFDKQKREHIPMVLIVLDEKIEKAARAFFVRMFVPGVEPDEYTLILVAEDEALGVRFEIACDFAVEDAVKKGGLGR